MRFRFTDLNPFPLPGTNGKFIHLATIQYGLREFIYFTQKDTHLTWIEEITGGKLIEITDDNLWNDLAMFVTEKNVGRFYNHDA